MMLAATLVFLVCGLLGLSACAAAARAEVAAERLRPSGGAQVGLAPDEELVA